MSREQRSYTMSRIRSNGTLAERRLGELVREMLPNAEIIEHPRELPGKPDFWLPTYGLALFADGCFFHKCPKHFQMPDDNRTYWEKKVEMNCKRDRKTNRELRALGIRPIRIWEHDLCADLATVRRKIRRAVNAIRQHSGSTM